ncbi:hypothetical protein HL653_11880 [Sphingomonas sp. AP4-R1]|uniref:hypothetical protein n=1 Tax=Sphingomonas sp. AP4-R1 TaxID=2735134 RepID=UPI00149382B9|nr:hypothetical protein [Sphingomonas sp. AP4-R1]QJU58378.1 hypothetical protein HL653_11880 [Sphingomonas sp. AP4-R1]
MVFQLGDLLPVDAGEQLRDADPESPVSARFALYQIADKRRLWEAARTWLLVRDVFAYHGTRINDAQRRSIEREGLRPLIAVERVAAIEAFLGEHPRWPEIGGRVAEAIEFVCSRAGNREGMVYGLFSRSGLVRGCNHYLVEGSEFDHHVANYLLNEICHDENRRRGQGTLLQFRLTGEEAIAAANPRGEIGDEPNLLAELIGAVAWWLTTGDDDTAAQEEGCGLMRYDAISPDRITAFITVPDEELWPHYDNRAH